MFFDASQEESVDLSPIPAGEYAVVIKQAESVKTPKGGQMVKCTYEVLTGPCEGRQLIANFNLFVAGGTPNAAKASKIGRGQMKAQCEAIGRPQLRGPKDLEGGRLVIKVNQKPHEGEIYNNVKDWKPLPQASQAPQTASQGVQNQQRQAPPPPEHEPIAEEAQREMYGAPSAAEEQHYEHQAAEAPPQQGSNPFG